MGTFVLITLRSQFVSVLVYFFEHDGPLTLTHLLISIILRTVGRRRRKLVLDSQYAFIIENENNSVCIITTVSCQTLNSVFKWSLSVRSATRLVMGQCCLSVHVRDRCPQESVM